MINKIPEKKQLKTESKAVSASILEPTVISNSEEIELSQTTEIGEALTELNKDNLDLSNKMSAIDMRTDLFPVEVAQLLAIDTLISMGMLPISCELFTRRKKRLNVSKYGIGRKQIVSIGAGRQEEQNSAGKSFFEKIGLSKPKHNGEVKQ